MVKSTTFLKLFFLHGPELQEFRAWDPGPYRRFILSIEYQFTKILLYLLITLKQYNYGKCKKSSD